MASTVEETDCGTYHTFSNTKCLVTVSEQDLKAMKRAYSDYDGQPSTVGEICDKFRLTSDEFDLIRRTRKWTHASPPFLDEEFRTGDPSELLEEALAHTKRSFSRKLAAKQRAAAAKAAHKWWHLEEGLKAFISDLAEGVEFVKPPHRRPALSDDRPLNALVFPTDLHYGKLGHAELGKNAGGAAVAKARLEVHCEALLSSAVAAGAGSVTLCVGSDGLNADNMAGLTTKGTPQSNDGYMGTLAGRWLRMNVQLVESARAKFGQVDVRLVKGNHDRFVSHMLISTLALVFESTPGVTVHTEVAEYQFWRWGRCMIMGTHGDGLCKTNDLARVMSTHRPDLWGECPYRYAIRGNLHHVHDDEGAGIRNILFPSLSVEDEYHARKWPILVRPLAKMLLLDKERGLVGAVESGPGWDLNRNDWADAVGM